MEGHLISQAATLTGFSPSALRFYEKEGLVRPARSASGYRCYDRDAIRALKLVKRARRLGIPLAEISTLLEMLGQDRCGELQNRVRQLLDERVRQANEEMGELEEYVSRLIATAQAMGSNDHAGPCDDECGCLTESTKQEGRSATGTEEMDCSLSEEDQSERLSAWRSIFQSAVTREPLSHGMRLTLPDRVDVARVVALARAEGECCPFLRFRIDLSGTAFALEITGPDQASVTSLVDAVGGTSDATEVGRIIDE